MQDVNKVNEHFSGELAAFERLSSLNISVMFRPKTLNPTDTPSISYAYLNALRDLMPAYADEANCRYCNELMDRFGDCYYLDKDGTRRYVFWDLNEAPAEFEPVFRRMIDYIESTSTFFDAVPFLGHNPTAGQRMRGGFYHYSFDFTKLLGGRSTYEYCAQVRELSGALQYMRTLELDSIVGSVIPMMRQMSFDDKFIKAWEFIEATWSDFTNTCHTLANNLVYNMDPTFDGARIEKVAADIIASRIINNSLCMYLRESTVLGPILTATKENLRDNVGIVLGRIDPLKYKRIQREFSEAALANAERELKAAGLENVTKRRMARWNDIERLTPSRIIWKAKGIAKKELSILSAIRTDTLVEPHSPAKMSELEKRTCSMMTLINRYLPKCDDLRVLITGPVNINGVTAPEYDDTPIIFKHGDNISIYAYSQMQYLNTWGLTEGWISITGIIDWSNIHGDSAVGIMIDGIKDRHQGALGLWKDRMDTNMLSPLVVNALAKVNEVVKPEPAEGLGAMFIGINAELDVTFKAKYEGKEMLFRVTAYE